MHYSDVIISAMVSQVTGISIVSSTVGSDGDQRKYQSSMSLAFVRGIHQESMNSPHKRPVTRKRFPYDDVIMFYLSRGTTAIAPEVTLGNSPTLAVV